MSHKRNCGIYNNQTNSEFNIAVQKRNKRPRPQNKTAAEAAQKIQGLKKKLKDNNFSFGDIIPVLLTDNGGEFSIVSAFEDDEFGNRETNLFFCEPSSPNEKPEIEKKPHIVS